MNKKLNTILFLIGGTVFNIVVTLGAILMLVVLWVRFIGPHVSDSVNSIGLVLAFVGGALIAFLLYRLVFGILIKKVDIEKYFEPLFKSRHRKKP